MAIARRCAVLLIEGAGRLIPAGQAEWGRAMAAEHASLSDDRIALAFSAGCLRAAAGERLRTLAPDGAWFWPGAGFGLLLIATALIPGSGPVPLLWAPVCGLLTVLALERSDGLIPFGRAVLLAFKTGLLSGALLLAGGCLVLLGSGAPLTPARLTTFAVAAGAIAFLTTISGVAAAPLVCRPPGAGASSAKET